MRWWLNTDHKRFSVDNAVVNGLDFSSLDPSIWMVQWTDGKGEIERQDVVADTNDNGLRETFIDVTPYAPLFQQFLALCPLLTLPQAKKVQIDLIGVIFDSKRQAPFHYPVAAGDYYWDATDATMGSSMVPAIQNLTVTLNSLIAKVNAVVAALTSQINGQIETIDIQGNNWAVNVNNNIVNPGNNGYSYINTIFGEITNNIVTPGNLIKDHLNNTVLGHYVGVSGPNTINNKLQSVSISGSPIDGLAGEIVGTPYAFSAVDTNPYVLSTMPIMFALTDINPGWTDQADVPTSNVQWIPIGSSTPVNVTPAEQAAILSGIAARTNDLNVKKNKKIAEVNALTTISAVINYNVTTGW